MRQPISASGIKSGCRFPFLRRWHQQLVVQALMRPLGMIVFDELAAQVIHVPLAEHHEIVEAFLLDALHEPLDKGRRVGCAIGRSAGLDPGFLQGGIEARP